VPVGCYNPTPTLRSSRGHDRVRVHYSGFGFRAKRRIENTRPLQFYRATFEIKSLMSQSLCIPSCRTNRWIKPRCLESGGKHVVLYPVGAISTTSVFGLLQTMFVSAAPCCATMISDDSKRYICSTSGECSSTTLFTSVKFLRKAISTSEKLLIDLRVPRQHQWHRFDVVI
jgi:hypothetical protein